MSNKVPQIRFNGYSDAWVQRNLSELLQERNQQIEPNEEYKLMSFVAGTGVTPKGERYDRSALVTNDSKKYKVTEFGDFIYSSNNLETGSIGFNRTGKAVISPVYSIFYSTENADSRFIGLLSSQKQFIHSMVRYRQGVVYGQWRIHESDFLKIAVSTPKLDEQDKIIDFFERFDNLIAANQRKLDLLKEQKKGYLQKMFPKNGEKVPELRFAGFADDWEERKLGELSNIVGGGTPSTSNTEYWDGDIDWYAPAEIGEQSYVSKSKKTITELGLKKSSARILPIGTVLFTSRAGIGNTAILAKEATTNQGFQSIVPDQNKLDSYFIFSRTNELKRYGEVTGAGSTFVEVSGKQMSKMSIMVPELSEQQKIGSFFKQLDNTIALHQRKLDLLKEQKKGFLQKMFV